MDKSEIFEKYGKYSLEELVYSNPEMTLEELYQSFKERYDRENKTEPIIYPPIPNIKLSRPKDIIVPSADEGSGD